MQSWAVFITSVIDVLFFLKSFVTVVSQEFRCPLCSLLYGFLASAKASCRIPLSTNSEVGYLPHELVARASNWSGFEIVDYARSSKGKQGQNQKWTYFRPITCYSLCMYSSAYVSYWPRYFCILPVLSAITSLYNLTLTSNVLLDTYM